MSVRRVYVADDDPAMRQLVTMAMAVIPDVALQVFDNGLDLLRAVQDAPPDLVVTDIMLPRLEGLAVAGFLKFDEALHHVPVLVISSVMDRDNRSPGEGRRRGRLPSQAVPALRVAPEGPVPPGEAGSPAVTSSPLGFPSGGPSSRIVSQSWQ